MNQKNNAIDSQLDSVNFSSVDVFPSFPVCDSLIDTSKKNECFRNTIHQLITEKVSKYQFITNENINELILLDVLIDLDSTITLKNIQSSEIVKKEFPELDSLLKVSVESLPKMYPATKRGIPVASKYQLPIQIQSEDLLLKN